MKYIKRLCIIIGIIGILIIGLIGYNYYSYEKNIATSFKPYTLYYCVVLEFYSVKDVMVYGVPNSYIGVVEFYNNSKELLSRGFIKYNHSKIMIKHNAWQVYSNYDNTYKLILYDDELEPEFVAKLSCKVKNKPKY